MKVVAFNGSPRKNGNTATLIQLVFSELGREGIETEIVPLAGKKYRDASPVTSASKTRTSDVPSERTT
jgi:multimeric flavodoxin WrbA